MTDGDGDEGAVARAAPRMARTLTARVDAGLSELLALADLDRATDFRHQDLRGWRFDHHDLRGFDLTGSDLRGTGVEHAVVDETTVLVDADLDPVARKRLLRRVPAEARRARIAPGAYTRVHIPDLTDEELLERSFVIRDPLALEGVVQAPPPTDQLLSYEGRYDVASDVRCAFGHRHKRGYVFRDEHGMRYLVGNSCGSKHLGMAKWQEFKARREDLEERASRLKSLRDLREGFARSRPALAAAARGPAVQAFDRARELLANDHPQLVRAVRALAAFGGRVQLATLERDFAAEERERERAVAKAQKAGQPPPTSIPERTRTVMKDAGALVGRLVFEAGASSRTTLSRALRHVDAFLASDVLRTRRDLQNTLSNARRVAGDVVGAADAPSDFRTLFAPSNLSLFTRWANQHRFDDCDFSLQGELLIMTRRDGRKTVFATPPKLDIGDLADLRTRATT